MNNPPDSCCPESGPTKDSHRSPTIDQQLLSRYRHMLQLIASLPPSTAERDPLLALEMASDALAAEFPG